MARTRDEEFAIERGSHERATLRHGKGRPMKALLKKKWGTNYAGQVLTNVQKGSIPDDVAVFYEDDEPSPMDVVKDPNDVGGDPLAVINDAINPKGIEQVEEQKRGRLQAARDVSDALAVSEAVAAEEQKQTQRRAREADQFAASRQGAGRSGSALSKDQKEGFEAGKGHGPNVKKLSEKEADAAAGGPTPRRGARKGARKR